MKIVSFTDTKLTDGFWKNRLDTVSNVSVYNVLRRFTETGRLDALRCEWTQGDANEPHIFWDSDIAKWIESVAYILESESHPELESAVDSAIDAIASSQLVDGYYNCCYISKHLDKRWTDRTDHELYCAGHLIEAAVAYFNATGKRKLLDVMEKYLEHIYNVFVVDKSATFTTPGHEEIELALVKLYNLTDNEKYLELCKFFVDSRGVSDEQEYNGVAHKYSQSHLPVREQFTAEGHCVRACYLYMAMADLARLTDDDELLISCKRIFDDIISKKMYITGGIGSSGRGEAFTVPYDLPNLTAYSESCAALALAWFAQRMTLLEADSKYADTIERVLYNNGLSSVSLDGKAFFYVNPLEIRTELLERNTSQCNTHENLPITERKEVFDCSCCPPNITRFIASVADFLYTCDDDTVFVHQYMASETKFDDIRISQKTSYPNDGKIEIVAENVKTLAVRIPYWCSDYSITLNGAVLDSEPIYGYVYIDLTDEVNSIELDFDMSPRIVYPNSKIRDCSGKVAVVKGPVVYCAESTDNNFNLMAFKVDTTAEFTSEYSEFYGTYVLSVEGKIPTAGEQLYSFGEEKYEPATLKMIPYFGFANRGQTDMEIYFLH
ncbi:MAG: glycoside hydrolase family 127 protein [Clostridia bacterium]|nr:glycoside hydrolase family 127 protein [Clostridia bacterium]